MVVAERDDAVNRTAQMIKLRLDVFIGDPPESFFIFQTDPCVVSGSWYAIDPKALSI
jgi:hypothetical protein